MKGFKTRLFELALPVESKEKINKKYKLVQGDNRT